MSKKKTLDTMIEDHNREGPDCPNCKSDQVIRSGKRKVRDETVQIFYCKSCCKYFNDRKIPHGSYPPRTVLEALSYYNQGHSLSQTVTTMRRRHRTKIPVTTLHTWVLKHENELPISKMRRTYRIDPDNNIRTRRLFHPQPYVFKTHTLKLNIKGKTFPGLKRYIYWIMQNDMDHIFRASDICRCSELAMDRPVDRSRTRAINTNSANRMTNLALELARTKNERHTRVEEFFLVNDSATVSIEVPVYMTPKELKNRGIDLDHHLTGHIDMIQVRNNRVHILDYKPDARSQNHAEAQLQLYAMCLSARTGIDPRNISCAYFDERDYFEMSIFNDQRRDSIMSLKYGPRICST